MDPPGGTRCVSSSVPGEFVLLTIGRVTDPPLHGAAFSGEGFTMPSPEGKVGRRQADLKPPLRKGRCPEGAEGSLQRICLRNQYNTAYFPRRSLSQLALTAPFTQGSLWCLRHERWFFWNSGRGPWALCALLQSSPQPPFRRIPTPETRGGKESDVLLGS